MPDLDTRWRTTAERLTQVVIDVLPDVEHARKWGRLTFTWKGDWHHWLCAIAPSKNAVRLVLHKGALLADPDGLMEGEGRYTRAISYRSPEGVDVDALSAVLHEASARQTEMLPSEAS
jgi:hypothetical protein